MILVDVALVLGTWLVAAPLLSLGGLLMAWDWIWELVA